MYNLKKVIASICVIAMMLTTVAFAATYSDVAEDSAYYEAVETLNKLGIVTGYEDGTYKPEDGVTRAEMAALVARIQGFGETAAAQTATAFADVPASHWASGYVASAASLKIINGYGDGNFGPEDPVLFEQAVKMVMATLGYTPYAEFNGGYPGGYISAAQRYSVLAGVSNATMGTKANRGTIAQLLANAIDTPIMKQASWSTSGEVGYVICDGLTAGYPYTTLMSENLGVVKIRGIVTANAYTAINEAKDINLEDEAAVVIAVVDAFDTTHKDFKNYNDLEDEDAVALTFLAGESDAADYIGKSVVAYVTEDDDEWTIISIAEDTTRNDSISMDLSQFNKINASGKFEYYKSATAKTATAVTLDENAVVVYNNVGGYALNAIFDVIVAEGGATLDGGKITLVDNNDTKGYDVIFVEVAETAVVDEAEEGYVAFKEATATNTIMELEVDEDDTDKVVVVTKDGAEIALADLAEWDVLSIIAAADDASYILAEVVSNQVVGAITSEAKSATSAYPAEQGKKYTIAGAKYDVAAGAYGVDGMAVGDGGTFYIDKYGKIAAFNEDAALATGVAANYAYVTAVAFDKDILTGKATAIVQMVTAEGVVALNIKATGAKLNGETIAALEVNDDDEVIGDDVDAIKALENQMIKYTKNSSDLITAITELDEDDDITGGMSTLEDKEYDAEDNRFVDGFYLDANSYVFFIAADAEDSFLGTEADLADGESYTIYGKYADKKAEENNIAVIKLEAGSAGKKAGLAVITSVGVSENEDGEAIFSIEAIVNGELIAADTTAEVTTEVTPGDIVKIKVAGNGLISAIDMVFDFDIDEKEDLIIDLETAQKYASEGKEVVDGGIVDNFRDASKTATIGDVDFKLTQAANVIVIDDNGRKIEMKKGSVSSFKYFKDLYAEDVTSVKVTVDGEVVEDAATQDEAKAYADMVFARKYDGRVTDVIIIKGSAEKIKAN